jgi:tetratricopeptide (TPR) repeat protein
VTGTEADERYQRLLAVDRQLALDLEQAGPNPGMSASAGLRARLRRLESDYRHFVREHPQHARGLVAFGSFLEDVDRRGEALTCWEKAVALPEADAWSRAHALNNLANYWGHEGDPQRALRDYERAFQLLPEEPIFRFNWATICSLYRTDAQKMYGWDTTEIFQRSLEQFRRARDLAPQEPMYAFAYAETFYLMKTPDWPGAYVAWKFCLDLPFDKAERGRVYGHLVRVCLNLNRPDEARQWLVKMQDPAVQSLRSVLERRLSSERSAGPVPVPDAP